MTTKIKSSLTSLNGEAENLQNSKNSTQTTMDSKPFFNTQWSKAPRKEKVYDPISKTVPDQSQKLATIMNKYSVGMPTTGFRKIHSENPENDFGINPKKLDYVEIQRYLENNKKRLQQLQEKQLEFQQNYAQSQKQIDERNQQLLEAAETIRQSQLAKP